MIESPALDEVFEILRLRYLADERRQAIVDTLERRFGPLTDEQRIALHQETDLERLRALHRNMDGTLNLTTFFAQLEMPNTPIVIVHHVR